MYLKLYQIKKHLNLDDDFKPLANYLKKQFEKEIF